MHVRGLTDGRPRPRPRAQVLRDIREGRVEEVLWFYEPGVSDPYYTDGRCLVRYKDDGVAQSVIPLADARIPYAMAAHGVRVRRRRRRGRGGGVCGEGAPCTWTRWCLIPLCLRVRRCPAF